MHTRLLLPLLLLPAATLTGCSVVGDILKLGVWAGIIIAVVVIGLIWMIASRFRRK